MLEYSRSTPGCSRGGTPGKGYIISLIIPPLLQALLQLEWGGWSRCLLQPLKIINSWSTPGTRLAICVLRAQHAKQVSSVTRSLHTRLGTHAKEVKEGKEVKQAWLAAGCPGGQSKGSNERKGRKAGLAAWPRGVKVKEGKKGKQAWLPGGQSKGTKERKGRKADMAGSGLRKGLYFFAR
jgi:hypothetical protein